MNLSYKMRRKYNMNKTGKRWICFLALLMWLCLLFTSCAPAPQQPAGSSEAQIENLTKLCKVWGLSLIHI